MSFSGDLEHLPIVDVIQLLHSTQKTGTLYLKSLKGESQLVFNGGYIVSANHVRNNIRIGQILVEMGAVTTDQLEQALSQQLHAGNKRKPLLATLIESGQLNRDDAYSGLETLIELTIVEILTWESGTFSLDVHSIELCDEYRYFPETLKQELYLNTQGLLMDALRIYDEKMRDGSLHNGAFSSADTSYIKMTGKIITADDLGLDDLDTLDTNVPDVFIGLKDYDSAEIHRQIIRETIPGLVQPEHDKLLALFMDFSESSSSDTILSQSETSPLAIILFSQDELIRHCVTTVCKHGRIFTFATDDPANLDLIIEQSFSKELIPLLVIDAPHTFKNVFSEDDTIALLQQKHDKYPQISILQFVTTRRSDFSLRALQSGAKNIISRPHITDDQDNAFTENICDFIKAFHLYLQKIISNTDHYILQHFKECFFELGSQKKIQDVAFVVLKFASCMFERTLTFVVGNNELIAEKGYGITGDKTGGASQPLLFTIPLIQQSVFQDVIKKGTCFYGQCNDSVLRNHLYAQIGAPHSPKIILMPIKTFGKTIAFIYGDFGARSGSPLHIDLLEIVARHAELVLDNNLYRKKVAAFGTQK